MHTEVSAERGVQMADPIIRPYRPADRAGCYDVCVRTAAAGGDARGLYSSDELVPDLFCGPYLDLDAESAFVVDTGERVAGYVIAASDTREFVRRYRAELLPRLAERYPFVAHPVTAEDFMVNLDHTPERMLIPQLDDYPAHLDIDLLPELQASLIGPFRCVPVATSTCRCCISTAPSDAHPWLGVRRPRCPRGPCRGC